VKADNKSNACGIEDINTPRFDENLGKDIFVGNSEDGDFYHITVAVLFTYKNKILMIKKSDPTYEKKFSIIAGHLENGESPNIALLREVREELSVTLTDYKFFKKLVAVRDRCRHGLSLHNWYIYSSQQFIDIRNVSFDPKEIEKIEWVDLQELKKMKHCLTQGAYMILEKLGYLNE